MAEVRLINKPFSNKDQRSVYAKELLTLALSKTQGQYGETLIKYTQVMNEERAKSLMVKENYGDIINGATRESWEQELIPIKIPILKGLMGMRVFLINKEQQPTFAKITSLDELKKLHLGSGHIWAITKRFKQNGFTVITSSHYASLFKMLAKNRFDFFPRGVNEILSEYKFNNVEFPRLHIEETILLKVNLPTYFFVNPKKPILAKRILTGLTMMVSDGSFDNVFNKHFGQELSMLNIDKRKVLEIH